MRVWARVCGGVCAWLLCAPCHAADIPDAVEAAFRDWLGTHSIEVGTLALMQGGELVREIGIGTVAGDTREIASLSKAITAVCAMSLIKEGRWSEDTQVVDVFGYGPTVTVKQLMTHSTGLTTDSTQTVMSYQLDQPDAALDLEAVFARGAEGPVDIFHYNNENFAVLGAMIAQETSQTYAAECDERVLKPAGVSASLSQRSGAFGAYGGWAMPASDYARFHNFYFGPDGQIGRHPSEFPKIKINSTVYYGTGMYWRPFRDGHNFWHFGALCFPGRLNVGSFAVQFAIGWNLVATYDGCVGWDAMGALDQAMVGAIFEN